MLPRGHWLGRWDALGLNLPKMIRHVDDVDALLKARAEIDEQLRKHKNTLTVLFTDIAGSTSFFDRNGDDPSPRRTGQDRRPTTFGESD